MGEDDGETMFEVNRGRNDRRLRIDDRFRGRDHRVRPRVRPPLDPYRSGGRLRRSVRWNHHSRLSTLCLSIGSLVEAIRSKRAVVGGLGIDDVTWPPPVEPGDTLSVRTEVLDIRPSESDPRWGSSTRDYGNESTQGDGALLSFENYELVRRRDWERAIRSPPGLRPLGHALLPIGGHGLLEVLRIDCLSL